jgi:hypothetical protein
MIKPSVPLLLPGLVLSLAVLPASRGECALLRKDVVEARQTLVAMLGFGEKRGIEPQAQMNAPTEQVCARVARLSIENPRG